MTFDKIIEICEPLELLGEQPERIGRLTHDSRQVAEGDLFIALRGTRFDGHDFIESAVEKGASAIICEETRGTGSEDVYIIKVENTRTLVGPLAQAFEGNPAEQMTLVGVTGTNGKTTVVTLIYQVLEKMGASPSMLGTTGKMIGENRSDSLLTTSDPVELARDMRKMADADSTHLVMEVSSHALDQQRVAGLDFDVAVFTNLSHDHLDYHQSINHYAESKKRLFDGLESKATAVINADDSYSEQMVSDCKARIARFGFSGDTDITCRIIESGFNGTTLAVDRTVITSPLVGSFNAYNLAAAFIACRAMNYEVPAITDALNSSQGAPGRLERIDTEDKTDHPVVLVDYAHTPDALENVLSALKELKSKQQKLHVVFGCGGDRDHAKRPVMAGKAQDFADAVVVTSDNPRNEDPEAIIDDIMEGFDQPGRVTRIADRRKAIEETITRAGPDTLILIAGKGHETYQEIDGDRHPFDDRQVARQALKKRNGNTQPEEVA